MAASEDAFAGTKERGNNLIEVLRGKVKELLVREAALLAPGRALELSSSFSNPSPPTMLSRVLVDQCVTNFVVSTATNDRVDCLVEESLHPYFAPCNYKGTVKFKGAKALRVRFGKLGFVCMVIVGFLQYFSISLFDFCTVYLIP